MQTRVSTPQSHNLTAWLAAVLGVGLLVVLLLSFMSESRPASQPVAPAVNPARVAYLQFGLEADTLFLADPSDPTDRRELFSIPHAPEYGVVPSISPSREQFAFTALPAGLKLPSADTPAGLWVSEINRSGEPQLLLDGVDLLVKPVWTPDGSALVYRRTDPQSQVLAIMPVDGGEERVLAYADGGALFPVAFTPGGDLLYFVALDEAQGTRLFTVTLSNGTVEEVRALSPGLTRDWTLSPNATQLAFLEVALTAEGTTSLAYVFDIAANDLQAVTTEDLAAFSPVWDADGRLTVGAINQATGGATLVTFEDGARTVTEGPEAGFDVPLSSMPGTGGFVVRSFENESVSAPGKSSLTLIDAAGERRTIATGEVTFVGWTTP